jgi:hypothetical protein
MKFRLKFVRPIKKLFAIAAILIVTVVHSMPSLAQVTQQDAQPRPLWPIHYGYVCLSELIDLAPESASEALRLLRLKEFSEARPVLQQEYDENPSSLPLFVALAQVTPDLWAKGITSYNQRGVDNLSYDDKFRLGTLLFYVWRSQTTTRDMAGLSEAQEILATLWGQQRTVIVGLMLADAISCGRGATEYANLQTLRPVDIVENLVGIAGGQEAYRTFLYAKQQQWNQPPPDIAFTPASQRRALLAVVSSLGSFAMSRQGTGRIIGNRVVPVWFPFTPLQLAEQDYYNTWHTALLASISGET